MTFYKCKSNHTALFAENPTVVPIAIKLKSVFLSMNHSLPFFPPGSDASAAIQDHASFRDFACFISCALETSSSFSSCFLHSPVRSRIFLGRHLLISSRPYPTSSSHLVIFPSMASLSKFHNTYHSLKSSRLCICLLSALSHRNQSCV